MEIKRLQPKTGLNPGQKLTEKLELFHQLVNELNKKNLPNEIVNSVNQYIDEVSSSNPDDLPAQLKEKQSKILKLLEKELKMVTKNHYRNLWLILGMSAFGLPLGVAFGLSVGNIGLLSIGLPIGMVIGMAIGTAMDKKARDEGKQLDVEIR